MNDQNLVIATVRVRVGYICFVGDISNVNTKGFLLFAIFTLSSLPACHAQFRFISVGYSLNFSATTIVNRLFKVLPIITDAFVWQSKSFLLNSSFLTSA